MEVRVVKIVISDIFRNMNNLEIPRKLKSNVNRGNT